MLHTYVAFLFLAVWSHFAFVFNTEHVQFTFLKKTVQSCYFWERTYGEI